MEGKALYWNMNNLRMLSVVAGILVMNPAQPLEGALPTQAVIGGEYQLNIIHSNDGLTDGEVKKRYPTTGFNLKGVKVSFKGQFSDDIGWFLLYKAKETELERFYLTHSVTDKLDLIIGKQKIKVYGLHRKLVSSVSTAVTGAYLDQNPLKDKMAFDITYRILGTMSLQLVEDFSRCTAVNICTSYNRGSESGTVANSRETQTTQKQPAVTFEWLGSWGDLSPLIQYGVYDLGKSRTASAGIRYKNQTVDSYLDFTVDTRNLKGVNQDDPSRLDNQKNIYLGAVLYGESKLTNYTPFLHLSYFDTKPYEKPDSNEKEKRALLTNNPGKLDKNERTAGIGTHCDGWGAFYRPYVLALYGSGRFVDPKDETKDKKLAKTDLIVGMIGKF
jgi:hypothetical protein